MSNLDPEARRLLDAALPSLSPSDAAKARIRAHLTALGPPGVGDGHEGREQDVDDAPSRDDLSMSKFKPLGLVLGGLVIGGIGGFVLGYQLVASQPHSTAVEASSSASLATSEATAITSVVSSNGVSVGPSAPSRDESAATLGATATRSPTRDARDAAARAQRDVATPTVAAPAGDEDEVTWVLRVRKALARGEPQLALGLLRELDVKVPKGRLGEERAAGRAIARCLLQPATSATERESFVARYPSSIHLARVTRSCSESASRDAQTTRDAQTRDPTKP